MARICARCNVLFTGVYAYRQVWCRVDQFYVCRRCWERGCGEGHGAGVKSAGWGEKGFVLAVLGTLFLAPWLGLLTYDAWLRSTWQAAPLTPIGDLQAGETAKISGTLSSASSVAFGGHEVRTRSGWAWEWNTTDEFGIGDSSGTIRVETDRWWTVADGPHQAGYATRVAGTVYLPGDVAYIVGRVAVEVDGTRYFEMLLLGPSRSEPAPSASGIAFAVLLGIVLGPSWIWVGIMSHRKQVLHSRAVRWVTGRTPEIVFEPRDERWTWLPNGTGVSRRARLTWCIVGLAGSAVLLWTFLVVARPHSLNDYVAFALIVMFLSIFPNFFALVWTTYGESRPSAVAFSDEGFHLWYHGAYDRLLQDNFIAWSEMKTIELRKAGKTSYWALERVTGEVEDLDKLSPANLKALREQWESRQVNGPIESPASRSDRSPRVA